MGIITRRVKLQVGQVRYMCDGLVREWSDDVIGRVYFMGERNLEEKFISELILFLGDNSSQNKTKQKQKINNEEKVLKPVQPKTEVPAPNTRAEIRRINNNTICNLYTDHFRN